MRRPDIRQRVIEAVLDLAAEAGVDDVHIIAALALHRRMTEAELRHAVGDRVYDAFEPRGALYNHDAEDPDGMVDDRRDPPRRGGPDLQPGRRVGPDRLREHQPRQHGRRLEVDRDRAVRLPGPPPPPQRRDHAPVEVVHGPGVERVAPQQLAPGRGAVEGGHQDLPDRDDREQRPVRRRPPVGARQARVGVERPRPGHLPRRPDGAGPALAAGPPQDPPRLARPVRADLGPGGRGRGRPPDHHRQRLRAAVGAGRGADRRPRRSACPTSARTTSTRS